MLQDDAVALWPGSGVSATERGCWARTWGLDVREEPELVHACLSEEAWLENAWLDRHNNVDFTRTVLGPAQVGRTRTVLAERGAHLGNLDLYLRGDVRLGDILDDAGEPVQGWEFVHWTSDGRAAFSLSALDGAGDPRSMAPLSSIGVLVRDDSAEAVTPGLVRFPTIDAALGALLLAEVDASVHPVFSRDLESLAVRLRLLLRDQPQIWMLNTGHVGGDARDVVNGDAYKVKVRHSAAMLDAVLGGELVWSLDEDFGWEVVDVDHPDNAGLLQSVPPEILRPERLYAGQGRAIEYRAAVTRHHQRHAALLRALGVGELG